MKTFLNIVAHDLLTRYGNDLRHVTVVFPGKRASLFLNQELARQSVTPVWAPRYLTIADLFMRLSPLQKSDPIDNVCTLYQIFLQVMGPEETETLDQFYGWGEIILQDFDDIDKHLADAKAIFTNIHDLEQLEDPQVLTPEQYEVLSRFFHNFNTEDSEGIRQRFLRIWSHMYEMYTLLRETLRDRGLGYEGMIFRDVAERLDNHHVPDSHLTSQLEQFHTVAFAGFNVLNSVEERLMEALQRQHQAIFYWDYDIYYTQLNEVNEAGDFMRRNLQKFPSALPEEEFDNLRHLSDVTFISTSSNNVQARYVTQWFKSPHDKQDNRNAIVLCDEGLLQPVLHSLPTADCENAPKSVNITMGFPLTEAPIYSFINSLFSLQVEGYDTPQQRFLSSYRNPILHHPYSQKVSLDQCFQYHGNSSLELLLYLQSMVQAVGSSYNDLTNPNVYEQLYIEAIFQTNLVIQQFIQLTSREENPLEVSTITLRRLMRRILSMKSIPFHGEPANGLQIMGVLETRCLDFSHLLMLSIEEKNLPKSSSQNSMIPANLRTAFHLTTVKHKIAVYAYYFYRLIQRTEHLTCVYNENCVGNSQHEISRFLRQLLAETDIPVRTLSIQNRPQVSTIRDINAQKTDFVMNRLRQMYILPDEQGRQHIISPTAINVYLRCPMMFYYHYIAGLAFQEDPEDEINAPIMGEIFHLSAQLLYSFLMKRMDSDTIDNALLSNILSKVKSKSPNLLDKCLDVAFEIVFFHPIEEKLRQQVGIEMLSSNQLPQNEFSGEQIIIRDVLHQYLINLLTYDITLTPFRILKLEQYTSVEIPVETQWGPVKLKTGGIIDRMDILSDGTIRIVDYKTGSPGDSSGVKWENILGGGINHNNYYFQTFVYSLAEAMRPTNENHPIRPFLMYPATVGTKKFHEMLKINEGRNSTDITDFRDHADQFMEGLQQILHRLFSADEETHFLQLDKTEKLSDCMFCDFWQLCNRKHKETSW